MTAAARARHGDLTEAACELWCDTYALVTAPPSKRAAFLAKYAEVYGECACWTYLRDNYFSGQEDYQLLWALWARGNVDTREVQTTAHSESLNRLARDVAHDTPTAFMAYFFGWPHGVRRTATSNVVGRVMERELLLVKRQRQPDATVGSARRLQAALRAQAILSQQPLFSPPDAAEEADAASSASTAASGGASAPPAAETAGEPDGGGALPPDSFAGGAPRIAAAGSAGPSRKRPAGGAESQPPVLVVGDVNALCFTVTEVFTDGTSKAYDVNLRLNTCSCAHRSSPCCHKLAAGAVAADMNMPTPILASDARFLVPSLRSSGPLPAEPPQRKKPAHGAGSGAAASVGAGTASAAGGTSREPPMRMRPAGIRQLPIPAVDGGFVGDTSFAPALTGTGGVRHAGRNAGLGAGGPAVLAPPTSGLGAGTVVQLAAAAAADGAGSQRR